MGCIARLGCLFVLVCLALAVASWHGVEHPALRLKPRRTAPVEHENPEAGLMANKAASPGGP